MSKVWFKLKRNVCYKKVLRTCKGVSVLDIRLANFMVRKTWLLEPTGAQFNVIAFPNN
jgi:hypothetical protein